jgi:hypothetical protein
MVIVRILGGLGNQMFQYAYAKSLTHKGFKVQIDISRFKSYKLHGGYHLDQFNIDLETSSQLPVLLSKIGLKKSIKEKSLLFDENLLKVDKNAFIKGYFQTEKYFSDIRDILLKQFTIKGELSSSTKAIKNQINSCEVSCSLHIRRGDYISDKKANKVHGTCDIAYYQKAISYISDQHKNVHFFVFSDDIAWVKSNLNIENATFIDHKAIPHEDQYLMSLCKHNITANSSFSWWGAWLNQHQEKIVVAPKQWFVEKENEVACKSWIKL